MPYERFLAWQVAHELALELFRVTDRWPREERFGVTIQLRRAALSVPTNIAEGAAKRGAREFRRFLDIALGSLAEVSYLLRFSRDYGLLNRESWATLEALRTRAAQLTWKLYLAVSSQARRQVLPG
jgi:four helix bundle protein